MAGFMEQRQHFVVRQQRDAVGVRRREVAGEVCNRYLQFSAKAVSGAALVHPCAAPFAIAGEEVEISESFEYEDTDVLVIQSSLKEFILTVDGSGKDMKITLRSVEIPELVIGLPTPVYVNLGKPIIVEDFC